ncbi:MAG: NAD(P)H-dependent oxidoreductase [Gemmataceae bacterium]|nr:NAD(P)H-dependent oxidoreductase [Gemmataceae bacterium]
MTPLAPSDALAALKWRYATKKFDPAKTIPPDTWAVLEQALVLSPSSTGLQPWRFVVVTDPEVRKRLHPAAYNQPQILDCSHLVVFCGKTPPTVADADRHVAHTSRVRNVGPETLEGFRKMVVGAASRPPEQGTAWAARQCYIALGVFLTTAAMIGVDACPMEGFDPAKFDEALGLKARGVGSIALAAAGYRHPDDKYAHLPKVRFPADEVIEQV